MCEVRFELDATRVEDDAGCVAIGGRKIRDAGVALGLQEHRFGVGRPNGHPHGRRGDV